MATRSPQAFSSSVSIALSRLVIGTRCATGANVAPTPGRRGDPLGGRIGGDQLGMFGLDLAQLAQQRVVLGVADLGVIGAVVQLVVVADEAGQFEGTIGGITRVRHVTDSTRRVWRGAGAAYAPRTKRDAVA